MAEGRLGSSENTSKPRRCLFFVACFAVFADVPLVCYSKPSIVILISRLNFIETTSRKVVYVDLKFMAGVAEEPNGRSQPYKLPSTL
jgi:hypothetical protein